MSIAAIKRTARGFTLVEMSIVLVVLGLVAVAAFKFLPRVMNMSEGHASTAQFSAIENALAGFAFSHGRLPCPDSNHNGIENCTPVSDRGGVPFATLGLAVSVRNKAGLPLTYGVYRKASFDLAVKQDSQLPLLPVDATTATALETTLGTKNGLDLCQSLHAALLAPMDTNFLHTGSGNRIENVAWVLANPGAGDADVDGKFLDGGNVIGPANTKGAGFERTDKPGSASYNDRVVSMGLGNLWAKLGCSSIFSAAGHGHPDASLAAVLMYQGMTDYEVQLQLMADLAAADVKTAIALQLMAAAGVFTTASEATNASAMALLPAEVALSIPSIPIAAAAIAANIAAVVQAAVSLASIQNASDKMALLLTSFKNDAFTSANGTTTGFVAAAKAMSTDIRAHAVAADTAGLYAQ